MKKRIINIILAFFILFFTFCTKLQSEYYNSYMILIENNNYTYQNDDRILDHIHFSDTIIDTLDEKLVELNNNISMQIFGFSLNDTIKIWQTDTLIFSHILRSDTGCQYPLLTNLKRIVGLPRIVVFQLNSGKKGQCFMSKMYKFISLNFLKKENILKLIRSNLNPYYLTK